MISRIRKRKNHRLGRKCYVCKEDVQKTWPYHYQISIRSMGKSLKTEPKFSQVEVCVGCMNDVWLVLNPKHSKR